MRNLRLTRRGVIVAAVLAGLAVWPAMRLFAVLIVAAFA